MNILYALAGNYAGIAYHYLDWVNRHTQHRAKAFIRRLTRAQAPRDLYTGSWYDAATMPLVHADELADALAWAEVVHCIYGESPHTLGAEKLLCRKRWVYSWIGQNCSRHQLSRLFPHGIPPEVVVTHNAQGQNQYEPYLSLRQTTPIRLVPSIIDVLSDRLHPTPYAAKSPMVGMFVRLKDKPNLPDFHAATYPAEAPRVWADKGQARVREILDGYAVSYNASNLSVTAIINLRRACWLGIDELISPSWNTSAIEFLAVGTPVLNDVNEHTVACLRDVLGAPNPFLVCNWTTLRAKVEWYWNLSDADREALCVAAREWVVRYYNPNTIWSMHEELYNGR